MADNNSLQPMTLHPIDTFSMDDVIQNHNTFVNSGHNISTQSDDCELIAILGGMDKILSYILTERNPFNLNRTQLTQINNIFLSKTKNNDKKVMVYSNQLTSFEEVEVLDRHISDVSVESNSASKSTKQYETIYIKKRDTLLHDIFGKEKGEYILNDILYHKWMIILFMSISTITVIVSILSRFMSTYKIEWNVWFYPSEIFILFYSLILLTSVNKYLAFETMKKFDFWVKTLYTLRLAITTWISVSSNINGRDIMSQLIFIESVLVYSFVDGIQMPYKMKVFIAVMLAIYFSFFALMYTLVWDIKDLYIIHIVGNLDINITSLITSSFRVIALFIWKQTYKLIWVKSKSTSLSRSIIIKWIDN